MRPTSRRPRAERRNLLARDHFLQVEMNLGVRTAESQDDRREDVERGRLHVGQGQAPNVALRRAPRHRGGRLQLLRGLARLIQEDPTGLRQRDPPLGPVEQAHAETALQLRDLLAESRLRDAQAGRGLDEVELLGEDDERGELAMVHGVPS